MRDPPRIAYEQRQVHVRPEQAAVAAQVLRSLGVSTYCSRLGQIKAVIRLGKKGAADRVSIHQVEMRFADLMLQRAWLEMCWRLPAVRP